MRHVVDAAVRESHPLALAGLLRADTGSGGNHRKAYVLDSKLHKEA
jgi:hypothetical protein